MVDGIGCSGPLEAVDETMCRRTEAVMRRKSPNKGDASSQLEVDLLSTAIGRQVGSLEVMRWFRTTHHVGRLGELMVGWR